jgi:hypothetical protein
VAIGIVAGVALIIGGVFRHKQFFVSYFWAYFFWFGIWIGSAIIAMIHNLTGGKWSYPIKRTMEAIVGTLPMVAVLFVPVLIGCTTLYHIPAGFFIVRSIVFFAIWQFFASRLQRLAHEQNENQDIWAARRAIALSGLGVVILPLVATFAYADWIMSFEPRWRSTVFPIVLLAGQVLSAFAFCALLMPWRARSEAGMESIKEEANLQLGNLLLTFVLFWTYVAFGEFLIIYSANEPEEIQWYLVRMSAGWKALLIGIALLHFFVPFLLLLFRGFKRSSRCLAWLSAGLLAMHMLYTFWVIVPSITRGPLRVDWMDPVALIAIGGVWFAILFRRLGDLEGRSVFDVRRNEELEYADA